MVPSSLIAERLRRTAVLAMSDATAGTDFMSTQIDTGEALDGSLKAASLDRLVCLQRHWMWADEAMARFDRELADGWDYDDDPMSDHPFGAYYHWCALLCAFGEAALDHGLLITTGARTDSTGHRGLFARPLEQVDSFMSSSRRRWRSILVWWTCSAMARRCLGCGAFIWRSEKRSGRSTCRGRSTPWISKPRRAPACARFECDARNP
jgi:hypothetical protein